jgi:hypothetical protein
MSLNNISYDECSYKTELKKSTNLLEYMMYQGKYNNDSKCRFEFGLVGGNGVSIYCGNLVDLESDLRGQTRLLSDCPNNMFTPSHDKELSKKLVNQKSCKLNYYDNIYRYGVLHKLHASLPGFVDILEDQESSEKDREIVERFQTVKNFDASGFLQGIISASKIIKNNKSKTLAATSAVKAAVNAKDEASKKDSLNTDSITSAVVYAIGIVAAYYNKTSPENAYLVAVNAAKGRFSEKVILPAAEYAKSIVAELNKKIPIEGPYAAGISGATKYMDNIKNAASAAREIVTEKNIDIAREAAAYAAGIVSAYINKDDLEKAKKDAEIVVVDVEITKNLQLDILLIRKNTGLYASAIVEAYKQNNLIINNEILPLITGINGWKMKKK